MRSSYTCTSCSKQAFADRKAARSYAKAKHQGDRKAAYQCPTGNGWHVGSLPEPVIRGRSGRDHIWRLGELR